MLWPDCIWINFKQFGSINDTLFVQESIEGTMFSLQCDWSYDVLSGICCRSDVISAIRFHVLHLETKQKTWRRATFCPLCAAYCLSLATSALAQRYKHVSFAFHWNTGMILGKTNSRSPLHFSTSQFSLATSSKILSYELASSFSALESILHAFEGPQALRRWFGGPYAQLQAVIWHPK